MRDYNSRKNEIETIKPRTITINLSDADVKRLAEKSGEGGLTISGTQGFELWIRGFDRRNVFQRK